MIGNLKCILWLIADCMLSLIIEQSERKHIDLQLKEWSENQMLLKTLNLPVN